MPFWIIAVRRDDSYPDFTIISPSRLVIGDSDPERQNATMLLT